MNAVRHFVLAPMSIATSMFVVTLAGCGGDRVAAPLRADATIDATLGRLPDGSVSVHTVATNTGNVAILLDYAEYCNPIAMRVRGPQGDIRRLDPCGPITIPLCVAPEPLAPGKRVERHFMFDGQQYGDTCNSLHPIPPGSYEVVTAFTWHAASGGPRTSVSRFLPFDWPAP
jgi:hypothetical protein